MLIVGDPKQLPHVAESLRVGLPTFPLLYGPNVVVYLPGRVDEPIETEAEVLVTRFIILVGVLFAPRLLDLAALRDAGVFVVIATAVKMVPSVVAAPRELGLRARLAAGSLLAAPLTLVVAIAAIGRRLGAIDAAREASFLLLAILLSVGFPSVFRVLAGSESRPEHA